MKALVKFKDGKAGMELRDVPVPAPKDDELLIKVQVAGICGTDIHIMRDEYPSNRPVIMGHEYTGHVVEVGKNITGFRPGDQVISLTAIVTCGVCEYCQQGLLMLCNGRKSIGSGVNGAMAEYLVVPAHLSFRIPEEIQLGECLALSEPLACCVRAVNECACVRAGDVTIVSGPGIIGQLTAQLVRLRGAFVILSGMPKDAERLKLAVETGAADLTVSNPQELHTALEKHAPGGADVVFECAGHPSSLEACLQAVKKAGWYAQVGIFGTPVPVDMDKILTKELHFSTSYASEATSWNQVLKLLRQNKIRLRELASPIFPLEEWSTAFDSAVNQTGYKVLLRP